jgi:hypothetical protein
MAKKFKYDNEGIKYMDWWEKEKPDLMLAKYFLLENVIPQLEEKGFVHSDISKVDRYSETNALETKHETVYVYTRGICKCVVLHAYNYLSVYAFLPVEDYRNRGYIDNFNSKIEDYEGKYLMSFYSIVVEDWCSKTAEWDDGNMEKCDYLKPALDNTIDHIIDRYKRNHIHEMVWNSCAVERPDFVEICCPYNETTEQNQPHSFYGRMMFDVAVLCHYFDGDEMTDNYRSRHGNEEKTVM